MPGRVRCARALWLTDGGGGCIKKVGGGRRRRVKSAILPSFATKKALTKIFICVAVCTSKPRHAADLSGARAVVSRLATIIPSRSAALAIGRPCRAL